MPSAVGGAESSAPPDDHGARRCQEACFNPPARQAASRASFVLPTTSQPLETNKFGSKSLNLVAEEPLRCVLRPAFSFGQPHTATADLRCRESRFVENQNLPNWLMANGFGRFSQAAERHQSCTPMECCIRSVSLCRYHCFALSE